MRNFVLHFQNFAILKLKTLSFQEQNNLRVFIILNNFVNIKMQIFLKNCVYQLSI